MRITSLPPLPIEIWLQILRWATLEPWTHAVYATQYHPFEAYSAVTFGESEEHHTKYALALVCKQWRRWTMPLLYENIVVPRTHHTLSQMLHYGADWDDGMIIPPCAPHVRRASLPYSSTNTTSKNPPRSISTIGLCSSLEILVRHADALSPMAFEFTTECPPLPSLKRIDWWHHNEAARTGGINSLPHVLGLTPNLKYLSIGGEIWASYLNTPQVHLPHLTALRFRRVNAYFVMKLCRWSLPSLQHVVIDHVVNAEIFWPFWTVFGPQLRTVELGVSLKFFIRDFLAYVFAGCEELEEVNYHVHFTHPPPSDHSMMSLRTIGLHGHPTSLLRVGSEEYWTHLERHFDAFRQPTFPALKQIMLYGDWGSIMEDEEFRRITQPLRDKGCTFEVIAYTAYT